MAKLPRRLLPCEMWRAVSLYTRMKGTSPDDVPFVPRMCEPLARMLLTCTPMPPAYLLICAQSAMLVYMPVTESPTPFRKHEAICGRGVPALNSVGVACVNLRRDIMSYVSIASLMSQPWMPSATRSHMCCGRSTILPEIFMR